MILFARILKHFGKVLELLFELRDIVIIFFMLLFKLDIRDFKSVILSNELRHLVLKCIYHRIIKFFLALKLLNQILIQLSVIALIAVAIGLSNVAVGVLLLDTTCIQFHPLSDQIVSNEGLRARFLHFLLNEEVESIGFFIDELLF